VYLVDTSVWIETFRAREPLRLEDVVDLDEVATCLPVVQEVLQGFRDERAYRGARRSGLTIRSSIDCLIAAFAIRHHLTVLRRDRDYSILARVAPLLEKSL